MYALNELSKQMLLDNEEHRLVWQCDNMTLNLLLWYDLLTQVKHAYFTVSQPRSTMYLEAKNTYTDEFRERFPAVVYEDIQQRTLGMLKMMLNIYDKDGRAKYNPL